MTYDNLSEEEKAMRIARQNQQEREHMTMLFIAVAKTLCERGIPVTDVNILSFMHGLNYSQFTLQDVQDVFDQIKY